MNDKLIPLPDRNDVPGALAAYREALARRLPKERLEELTHILLRLQDDGSVLVEEIGRINRETAAATP